MNNDIEKSFEPEAPLLSSRSRQATDSDAESNSSPPKRNGVGALAFHFAIFILYTLLFVAIQLSNAGSSSCEATHDEPAHNERRVFTPAKEVIKYHPMVLQNSVNMTSPYKGPKNDAIDEAWRDIFRFGNIRVTKEELDKINRTSVPLADGSGDYLGALDVYHQLHCLKYIRHYVRGYEMEKTNVPVMDHLDHCIDSLRRFLMCRADGAILTYSWLPDLPVPWANFEVEHECLDWDAVHAWSKERSIDIYDPNVLVHPVLGSAYGPDTTVHHDH